MKKKVIALFSIVAILGGGLMIWVSSPVDLLDLDPREVKKIVVFNGNTGQTTHIDEKEQVQHIIENLNDVQVERTKPSVGASGFGFDITIYPVDSNDTVGWHHFIINAEDVIRKDPFFYTVTRGTIDYSYIQSIVA